MFHVLNRNSSLQIQKESYGQHYSFMGGKTLKATSWAGSTVLSVVKSSTGLVFSLLTMDQLQILEPDLSLVSREALPLRPLGFYLCVCLSVREGLSV